MERRELADLRREFASHELSEDSVAADPYAQFTLWFDEALRAEVLDPNAMTVATASADGRPSARVVLLKAYDADGFVFFTNYGSRKARDLDENANAMLLFYWPQLDRQAMISGTVERTSREESETYFLSRPVESRLGAWASQQSTVIESREVLEQRVVELREKYGEDVPLPPFWGGFRVRPERFEFWQGRQSRLHDRIEYRRASGAEWQIVRLSP